MAYKQYIAAKHSNETGNSKVLLDFLGGFSWNINMIFGAKHSNETDNSSVIKKYGSLNTIWAIKILE